MEIYRKFKQKRRKIVEQIYLVYLGSIGHRAKANPSGCLVMKSIDEIKDANYNFDFKYQRVIVPEVISIHSNSPKIHYFSFGEFFYEDLFPYTNCCIKIFFDFKPRKYFIDLLNEYGDGKCTKYSDSVFLKGIDTNSLSTIYRKKAGFVDLFMLTKISQDRIELYVNKHYYSLFKLRIENVVPPGLHLRDITYLKLLLNDFLTLHASAFATSEDEGYLVLAPPNTGKSFVVTKLAEDGFKLLSEDLSVVNLRDLCIHAVPYTATFYHETSKLKYIAPLSYYIPVRRKVLGELFKGKIIPKAKLKKIFILEYGRQPVFDRVDEDSALVEILNLTRNEFNLRSNLVINAILYHQKLDLESIEKEKFSRLIKRIDVIKIRANSPYEYLDIIKRKVR